MRSVHSAAATCPRRGRLEAGRRRAPVWRYTPLPYALLHPSQANRPTPTSTIASPRRYTENQFDAEFIYVLREACYKYIVHCGDTTLRQIAAFVKDKGFSKVRARAHVGALSLRAWYTGCEGSRFLFPRFVGGAVAGARGHESWAEAAC